MVELWLVTLNLGEVPVVKVARILEFIILENNYAAALIAYC
jgi:hypothetical protein